MDFADNGVVGVDEAHRRFIELVEKVEAGEHFTIVRNGDPIATLRPVNQRSTFEDRDNAVARLKELSSHIRLDGLSIQELIREGRQ